MTEMQIINYFSILFAGVSDGLSIWGEPTYIRGMSSPRLFALHISSQFRTTAHQISPTQVWCRMQFQHWWHVQDPLLASSQHASLLPNATVQVQSLCQRLRQSLLQPLNCLRSFTKQVQRKAPTMLKLGVPSWKSSLEMRRQKWASSRKTSRLKNSTANA